MNNTPKNTPSLNLFTAITTGFPPPWRLEYHEKEPWHSTRHISKIVAANEESPVTLETYSGDGDMFNLRDTGAEALVTFVNAIHSDMQIKASE